LLLAPLGLALQGLRQALLEVADLGAIVLRRLAGGRSLSFRLTLRGLCLTTHQLLIASLGAEIDDRLGDGSRVSERKRCVADDVDENIAALIHTSAETVGMLSGTLSSCWHRGDFMPEPPKGTVGRE